MREDSCRPGAANPWAVRVYSRAFSQAFLAVFFSALLPASHARLIRETVGKTPSLPWEHEWQFQPLVREYGETHDLSSLKIYPSNISGTYKGAWEIVDRNSSARFPDLRKNSGNIIFQLRTSPTARAEVHFVHGEVVLRDGLYISDGDVHMRLEGVYVRPYGQLRMVLSSSSDMEGVDIEDGPPGSPYQLSLRESAGSYRQRRINDHASMVEVAKNCRIRMLAQVSPAVWEWHDGVQEHVPSEMRGLLESLREEPTRAAAAAANVDSTDDADDAAGTASSSGGGRGSSSRSSSNSKSESGTMRSSSSGSHRQRAAASAATAAAEDGESSSSSSSYGLSSLLSTSSSLSRSESTSNEASELSSAASLSDPDLSSFPSVQSLSSTSSSISITFLPPQSLTPSPEADKKRKLLDGWDDLGPVGGLDLASLEGDSSGRETCFTTLRVNATAVDLEAYYNKAVNYTLMVTFISFLQVLFIIRQMEHSSTQSGAAKVSMLMVGQQAIMDAYLCLLHLTAGIVVESLFNAFATAAFFKFVIFSIFEMRYLLAIWKARRPPNATTNWDAMRRELSMLYARFYGFLLAGILLMYRFHSSLSYLLLLFYSFWIPQIVTSVVRDSRKPLHLHYILGISITRLAVPLYIFGCPKNFMRVEPSPVWCLGLVFFVAAQVVVLLLQHFFGARCFIPRQFLPEKYTYFRSLDHCRRLVSSQCSSKCSSEEGSMGGGLLDCVICMTPVSLALHSSERMVTPCDHVFHSGCLQRWMDIKMECPTCRRPLPPI